MGYKDSTYVIDHTCPIVDDLTARCISLIKSDIEALGLVDNLDEMLINLVEKRIDVLVGKIKEGVTEKMRGALDTLVSEIDDLEGRLEGALEDSERFVRELENTIDSLESDVQYWESKYNELEN